MIAACSGPSPAPPAANQLQPKAGGTLRWGLLGNIVTIDGHNYAGTTHIFHVFDRLILLDEQLNWMPRLAERWDINTDYTQITLQLRKGVQFHTGRELTEDDVLWNFSRVKDPAVVAGSSRRTSPRSVISTETAAARAKQAYADFSDYLLDQSFTITVDTFLPRTATTARAQGVNYDMA